MTLSKNPVFNLKVVLQETNIAADTLRAWERRYGLPLPQRTTGGHRLYSQYDIETIKWLIARQVDGMSISRAVDLWHEYNEAGHDPLENLNAPALTSVQSLPITQVTPETNLDLLRSDWITACMKFNEPHSEQILNQAFSIFPVESVCADILQKGMAEIGGLWYENKASVQQEHFASGLAIRRLNSLLSASPAPSRNQTVLVGCPPDEWHTFTPLLLSLLLRRRGLNVIYLGANVPTQDFKETVLTVRGKLVILVAQTLTAAANLQSTAMALEDIQAPVGYGGRIFNNLPSLIARIPGHYLGNSIPGAISAIEQLLQNKARVHPIIPTSTAYLEAHDALLAKRTKIESAVIEYGRSLSIQAEALNNGVHQLSNNILAALQLGDLEYVSDELKWVRALLRAYNRSQQELVDFMNSYFQAVDENINGQGTPIKDWLRAQSKRESEQVEKERP